MSERVNGWAAVAACLRAVWGWVSMRPKPPVGGADYVPNVTQAPRVTASPRGASARTTTATDRHLAAVARQGQVLGLSQAEIRAVLVQEINELRKQRRL